jgi:hypothetical protein
MNLWNAAMLFNKESSSQNIDGELSGKSFFPISIQVGLYNCDIKL